MEIWKCVVGNITYNMEILHTISVKYVGNIAWFYWQCGGLGLKIQMWMGIEFVKNSSSSNFMRVHPNPPIAVGKHCGWHFIVGHRPIEFEHDFAMSLCYIRVVRRDAYDHL